MSEGKQSRRSYPRSPRLFIEVTDEIIESSKGRDSSHCMIAEAVKKAYPTATKVAVDTQSIRFSDLEKGHRYVYLTPRVAQVAIIQFDQAITPPAFQFRLRGAQIALAGGKARVRSSGSEKQQEQRRAAAEAAREKLKRARLVDRNPTRNAEGEPLVGTVPERVGGPTPPVIKGQRREFGLRAFNAIR